MGGGDDTCTLMEGGKKEWGTIKSKQILHDIPNLTQCHFIQPNTTILFSLYTTVNALNIFYL